MRTINWERFTSFSAFFKVKDVLEEGERGIICVGNGNSVHWLLVAVVVVVVIVVVVVMVVG